MAQFNHRNIKILQNLNYEVHVAANFTHYGTLSGKSNQKFIDWLYKKGVAVHDVSIRRGFGKVLDNVNALLEINKLMKQEQFSFIHVHTPIASVLGRVIALKNKVPVVYTAHGFHFSKTSNKINWLIFPIEWTLSFFTKQLIVINQEDYWFAKRHLHAKYINYQAGVGINFNLLKSATISEHIEAKKTLLEKFNIPENARIIVSVGELTTRKNHRVVIEAIKKLGRSDVHYVIAGKGYLLSYLKNLAIELDLESQVHFMNYTTAIRRLNLAADVAVLPSLREGLSRAGLESIRDGVYLLGADIRGIKDYIVNDQVGRTFNPYDSEELATLLVKTIDMKRTKLNQESVDKLMIFDRKNIDKQMRDVYKKMGTGNDNRLRNTVGR
ncbi:MAG: glycosyltransferase [Leuconostoc mesenteroides]|uniref:glycosyltransferase n=1 Tax=Leuconostoc mesenteroides TaxID=1245 RepID=UPI00385B46D3